MKKILILVCILFIPVMGISNSFASLGQKKLQPYSTTNKEVNISRLYAEMKLKNKISYSAFEKAMQGYKRLNPARKDIITLIDFSKPSTEKRFFVLDIKRKKILKSSVVAHGKNSGTVYATSFSNRNGSFKSSLGFYMTETTYKGRNGYSLVLNGLEKGVNDNAKERAIVIHGANYANPAWLQNSGYLGRSLGCPALPTSVNREIIDTIKEGSLVFIYADDKDYLKHSMFNTLFAKNGRSS